MGSGCAECQRHGRAAGFFGIIDADRAAKLFGGVLDLAEIIGKGTVEVNTGISDADHGVAVILRRFDVDTFVLGAVNGAVEEVPEDKSQEIFVSAKFEIPVDLVDDDGFSAYGAGEEASH
jgi:hypothetical protein